MQSLKGQAIAAFKNSLPSLYQRCRPLVDLLISLFVEDTYLNLDDNDLPSWRVEKTSTEQCQFRDKIVWYLKSRLRDKHNGIIQLNDDYNLQFDDAYEDDVFVIVLYWYLNDDLAKFLRQRKAPTTCRSMSKSNASIHKLRPNIF
ncbi:hypothetical protein N7478_003571 [Penicillium angulare]|uniref:uncharacterized protein n=1 Tax=Penicillium angulare TaxID=116970 RepID=UPI002540E663|nr:uncharacterized protein N7478_003571 [Penicillium angulare]KAJ5287885.1 hypothetical protein N7478_003571 [Penicillium angulare]